MRTARRASRFRGLAPLAVLALLIGSGAADAREFLEAPRPQAISAEDLLLLVEGEGEGPVLVDTRGPSLYGRDHILGAINVHSKQIVEGSDLLEPYRARGVILYCGNGKNSRISALTLLKKGFRKVFVLEGTLRGWRKSGYPLEVPEIE